MLKFLKKQSKTILLLISTGIFLGIASLVGAPFLPALLISLSLSILMTLAIANAKDRQMPMGRQADPCIDTPPPPSNSSNLNLGARPSEPPVVVSSAPVNQSASNQLEEAVKALKVQKQKILAAIQEKCDREKQNRGTPEEQTLIAFYEAHLRQSTLEFDKRILEAKKQRDLASVKKQYDHSMQKRNRTIEEHQALEVDYQDSVKRCTLHYDEQIVAIEQQYRTECGFPSVTPQSEAALISPNVEVPPPAQSSALSESEQTIRKLEATTAAQTQATYDAGKSAKKELEEKHKKELNTFSGTLQARAALIERHQEAIKSFENKFAIILDGNSRQNAGYVKASKASHSI